MRDALGPVDENAQNAAAAGAEQLDVDDFEAFRAGYPLGNLSYFSYGLFLTNDWHSSIAIKKWAFAHWLRSTLSLYMTGRMESLRAAPPQQMREGATVIS